MKAKTQVTTIKLPIELKRRVARAVHGTQLTPHAFMVNAIASQTELSEKRRSFVESALAARQEALSTGLGHEAQAVNAYAVAIAKGKAVRPPKAVLWRK